ncbi:MAG: VTT domain-containing protein [Thermodesulfobacteriota bacterium]
MGDQRGVGPALPGSRPRLRPGVRLALIALVVAMVYVTGRATGVTEALTPESLRAMFAGAGVTGVVLFVAAFSIGMLAQLPGLLFIAVAVLAYGREMGAVVALGGAVVAATVSFVVVRRFGGNALAELESPFVRRWLARLDDRPLSSVILLRVVFGVAPFLNYALALSSLGFRDYLIGSVIGMAVPIGVAALVLDAAL